MQPTVPLPGREGCEPVFLSRAAMSTLFIPTLEFCGGRLRFHLIYTEKENPSHSNVMIPV